jgi:hypothetical protein
MVSALAGEAHPKTDALKTSQYNQRSRIEMKQFRPLGIMLTTVFTISLVASATAAAENPEILPVPTAKAPLKFTAEGLDTSYTLETTKLLQVICRKLKAKGEFTSQDSGTIALDFEECEAKGTKCKAEGDVNGTTLMFADINLVDLKKAGLALKEALGVEILPLNATKENKLLITCGVLKTEVIGSLLGREDKIKELVKTKVGELLFDQKEGEQEFIECELLKTFCEKKVFKLESNLSGVFELMGLLALKVALTFDKEFEAHY